MNKKYDVVIVGGGLSGLTSAALFSKAGMKTALLEMDSQTGGYLAGFERSGFKFDSSIHWLNQCGPNGSVTKVFKWIGDDYPKCENMGRIRRFVTDKHSFVLTNDPDEFKAELIEAFPHEKKGVERFFKDAFSMSKVLANYSDRVNGLDDSLIQKSGAVFEKIKFGLFFVRFVRFTGDEGIVKGLRKYFKDPELIDLWAVEKDLLSCLIPIAWAYNKDYQCPPVGGASEISQWLEKKCRENGCDIFCTTKVTKINSSSDSATSVTALKNGDKFNIGAKQVIVASDVGAMYEKLLNPSLKLEKIKKKLKKADLYSSAVTLSIGLNCPGEDLGFSQEIVVLSDSSVSRAQSSSGSAEMSCITVFSPTVKDPSLAPAGKGTLTIFAPAFLDHFERWKTELSETGELLRGKEYRKLKKEFADTLIERVEKRLETDIRNHIDHLDIATPVTYFRYTGNRKGSMMGARPGKTNFKLKIAHHKTPLKNVFLSGHWSVLGGGVPIAVSTAMASFLCAVKKSESEKYLEISRYLRS